MPFAETGQTRGTTDFVKEKSSVLFGHAKSEMTIRHANGNAIRQLAVGCGAEERGQGWREKCGSR